MSDLISRSEASEIIRSMTISLGGNEIFHPEAKKSVLGVLDDLAAVDAEPVRHGEWIDDMYFDEPVTRCTACKYGFAKGHKAERFRYCPHCGAKMDAEVSE